VFSIGAKETDMKPHKETSELTRKPGMECSFRRLIKKTKNWNVILKETFTLS
jgi:hypothetical protein